MVLPGRDPIKGGGAGPDLRQLGIEVTPWKRGLKSIPVSRNPLEGLAVRESGACDVIPDPDMPFDMVDDVATLRPALETWELASGASCASASSTTSLSNRSAIA